MRLLYAFCENCGHINSIKTHSKSQRNKYLWDLEVKGKKCEYCNRKYNVEFIEDYFTTSDDKFIKKYEKTGVEIKFVGIKRDTIFYVHPAVLRALKEQLK